MKSLKNVGVALLAVATICLSAPAAWSTPMVEVTYVESGGAGAWQYNFTVANTSDPVEDAGANIFDVFITLGNTFLPTSITAPSGWDYFDFGLGEVQFCSYLPPDGNDIIPGSSLGGFLVVLSDQLPLGTTQFTALLVNAADPEGDPIPYPAPVPEPSTLLLLGAGLLGALVIARRRAKRT